MFSTLSDKASPRTETYVFYSFRERRLTESIALDAKLPLGSISVPDTDTYRTGMEPVDPLTETMNVRIAERCAIHKIVFGLGVELFESVASATIGFSRLSTALLSALRALEPEAFLMALIVSLCSDVLRAYCQWRLLEAHFISQLAPQELLLNPASVSDSRYQFFFRSFAHSCHYYGVFLEMGKELYPKSSLSTHAFSS
jgi:hypothetical protein